MHVIHDRRVPLVPNVGIVVGERAGLVIDTGLGPRNGAYVLEQARSLLGAVPDGHPLPPRARVRRAGVQRGRDHRLRPLPA